MVAVQCINLLTQSCLYLVIVYHLGEVGMSKRNANVADVQCWYAVFFNFQQSINRAFYLYCSKVSYTCQLYQRRFNCHNVICRHPFRLRAGCERVLLLVGGAALF